MRLLAVETAVSPGSLALLNGAAGGGRETISRELPGDQRTAQSLAPVTAALLAEAGWKAGEIDAVAVTVGPGSFTGLRIGVTAAKTLAYAAGVECVAVNTLAVLAAQVDTPAAAGWAVLDAQRRELFAARLDSPNGVQILAQEDWLALLKRDELVTGPVLSRLEDRLPAGVAAADESAWAPRAETVAEIAAASSQRVSPFELLPNYYRLSAAEEKLL
ncbi:MAG: tRNA (adenosine(37)-N6)-threonylcarbamoyltransferase complex dimerization subunit type 1 TsaB [Planctomycetota bacterium]